MALTKVTSHVIAINAVSGTTIADNAITAVHIAQNAVTQTQIAAGALSDALAANSITAAMIPNDLIDSDHYAAGSIDNEHLADDAADSDEIAAGAIDLAHMSVNSIDSDQYVDGSIDTAHLAADAVTGAKIADDAIDSEHYTDGSIDTAHIANNAITAANLGTLTSLTVDNITLNGDTISHGGNLVIDCTGDMTLDAEGGEIRFKDDGTEFGNVSSYGGNLWFHSSIQDKDIAFRGDDGGSSITALLLEMDRAGAANFNSSVTCATSAKISQVALTSSSSAVAWDADAAANAYHLTTENTTFSAPSNATEGAIISIEIAQGGTARTIAWNTVFEFAASTAPTITATASKTDIMTFRYNGSVWQEIGRVQNMAQT
jgi:guanyl-specific ribonuclease Sa